MNIKEIAVPNIRINDLPSEASPSASDVVAIDGASTRKTTLTELVNAGRPLANQAEAEAGTDAVKAMTPLTTAQAIAALGGTYFATTAQGATADSALQPGAIGVTVQAYNGLLDSVSALAIVSGDILYGSGTDTISRLAAGTNGQVLRLSAGLPVWSTATGLGDLLAANNLSDLDDTEDARGNLNLAKPSATRTLLKALDWTKYNTFYLYETGREGTFRANLTNLIDTILGPAIGGTATAATDTIASTAHGLETGVAVVATTVVAGISTNTLMYVYAVNANSLQLMLDYDDAIAGTNAIDITADGAVSIRRHNDPAQGIYVTPDSDITGASGAVERITGPLWLWSWFGVSNTGTGGADQAPAINAWMAAANAFKPGMTNMGVGTFPVNSRIHSPTHQLGLEGEKSGVQQSQFYKRYVESDTYRGVLAFTTHGFNLRHFRIAGNAALSSGGSAWSAILPGSAAPIGTTIINNVDSSMGDAANYPVTIDGSANTNVGGPGFRDLFWSNSEYFSSALGTLFLKSLFNPTFSGVNAKGIGGTSLDALVLGGTSSSVTTNLTWTGLLAGHITVDFVNLGLIQTPTAGNITIGADCDDLTIVVGKASSVTFTSGATNCTVIGRITGTITGAGVNGCQVVNPTGSDWTTIQDGNLSGVTQLEIGGLSAYRRLQISGRLTPATDATSLFLRIGTTTVATGATDYNYQHARANGATASGVTSAGASAIVVSPTGVGNAAGEGIAFEFTIEDLNKSAHTWVHGRTFMLTDAGTVMCSQFGGQRIEAAAHDIFRLAMAAGNMSGNVTVKGQRG